MNKKQKSKILSFAIAITFFLFVILVLFYHVLIDKSETKVESDEKIGNSVENTVLTPKTVLEKYDSILISRNRDLLEVEFSKELFEEDGTSNENFFENLIDDMCGVLPKQSFILNDEKNNIKIEVQFNAANEKYNYIINGKTDFYKNINGHSYMKVEKSHIIEASNIMTNNGFLFNLALSNMNVDSIKTYLKDEKILNNGYYSYNHGNIKIKYLPNDLIYNMIFDKNYKSEIIPGVTSGSSLQDILNKYPDNTMGSIEKGYLGYRNSEYYFFFNGEEASCYGYRYAINTNFEKYVMDYLEDKDLKKFASRLKSFLSYDKFEFNEEINSLEATYPSRGIEVIIKDNNPLGIKLYSNYYFTEDTKKLVKDGKISFSTKDLIEQYEITRLNNE